MSKIRPIACEELSCVRQLTWCDMRDKSNCDFRSAHIKNTQGILILFKTKGHTIWQYGFFT